MGKTRDRFKKIRDNNQTFHTNISTIKDKNDKDLTEAEGIKKSWQECTEELYQKALNDWDNYNGVVTHIPRVRHLEYAVMWALGSTTINKASGGDEIPSKLFQILKADAVKVMHSVQFSRSVVSDSLQHHEPQHARLPCPSPTSGVHPNPCALSRWCHPIISSSVVPFSSCPQSFPASGSFQMIQPFASGSQNIGVSASASVLPVNTQDWSPLGWTGWISLKSKGLSWVFSNTTVQKHQFFGAQLSL